MTTTEEAIAFLAENNGVFIGQSDSAYCGMQDAVALCHYLALRSGWWEQQKYMVNDGYETEGLATKIVLIHSEVSEALEGLRKDKMDDHLPHRKAVEVELADAMIRIMDLAGYMKLDLAGAIIEKLAYNQQRADHKPENRAADGGKKF